MKLHTSTGENIKSDNFVNFDKVSAIKEIAYSRIYNQHNYGKELPRISIIIPTHNRRDHLERLIRSILRANYPQDHLEIIIIDDASTDGTYETIIKKYDSFKYIKIIKNNVAKFKSYCVNLGASIATGKYILIIDDDNIIDKNLIINLVNVLEKNDSTIGAVGAISVDPFTGRIWNGGVKYAFPGRHKILTKIQLNKTYDVDSIGNVFMIERELFNMLGGFNYKVFPFQDEDEEFLQRVRKLSKRLVMVPTAITYHVAPTFHKVNELRLYLIFRNRLLILKRYVRKYYLPYLFFLPVFMGWYLINIVRYHPRSRWKTLTIALWKGIMRGIYLSIFKLR